MKNFSSTTARNLLTLLLTYLLVACASGPKVINHGFEFHANWDSPDVEVIDFNYGDSHLPGVRNPEWVQELGKSLQSANTNGAMRVGNSLYVKWRIKSTQEVYQDTVELRGRLPADMENKKIYFVIKGPKLYVYLIFPEELPPGAPPNDLRMYKSRKVIELYPDHQ
jgi:hypothetical protein